MKLRNETTRDAETIRTITIDAFDNVAEANLIDKLRANGDLVISVVAEMNNVSCGHVALSRLKSPGNALALAPVSVVSTMQRKGIGSRLVHHALEQARALEIDMVFVLGALEYYSRFGFSPELAQGFASDYAGPNFMALWLGESRSVNSMTVVYPDAFADLA